VILSSFLAIEGAAGEVPGDLEVVADHGPVLLPTPVLDRLPLIGEALVHEVRVGVLEALGDDARGLVQDALAGLQEIAQVAAGSPTGLGSKDRIRLIR